MVRFGTALLLALLSLGCGRPTEEKLVDGAVNRAQASAIESARLAGFDGLPPRIYIRAFKAERELEIWGAETAGDKMKLVATFPIARMSGGMGPKRKVGDLQVPEGLYVIDRFNPNSQFHLSLGLNYPNKSDLVRSDQDEPGYDIFIHGSNVSIGCLAMTDPVIEEIWVFATTARDAGQRSIPVHIFPARMTDANIQTLETENPEPALHQFWKELKPFYDEFETLRIVPRFSVGDDGAYTLVREG